MCRKLKGCGRKIDPCMRQLIKFLRRDQYDTKASCCGHGKYPMTIVVKMWTIHGTEYVEVLSGKTIPREKKFYRKDKQDHYYIPECVKSNEGDLTDLIGRLQRYKEDPTRFDEGFEKEDGA